MKKASADVITLNLCNKKHGHMMYAYSDMECDRHNFLSFQAIFCSFTSLQTPKIKTWKKCKNTWRYYAFTHVYHKSRSYDAWFLRYSVQRTEFFVIFGHFYPLTLLTTQKIQILRKIKKTPWDIIILHFSTTNDYHMRRNGF